MSDIEWAAKIYIEGCDADTHYVVEPDPDFPSVVIRVSYREAGKTISHMSFDDESVKSIIAALTKLRELRK